MSGDDVILILCTFVLFILISFSVFFHYQVLISFRESAERYKNSSCHDFGSYASKDVPARCVKYFQETK